MLEIRRMYVKATFCGSTMNDRAGHHFTARDFESIGYHFLDSLLDYCDPDRTKVDDRSSRLRRWNSTVFSARSNHGRTGGQSSTGDSDEIDRSRCESSVAE